MRCDVQSNLRCTFDFFFFSFFSFWPRYLIQSISFVRQRTWPFLPGERERDQGRDCVPAMGRPGTALAQPPASQHIPGDAGSRELLPERRRRGAQALVLHNRSARPVATLRHPAMRSVIFFSLLLLLSLLKAENLVILFPYYV